MKSNSKEGKDKNKGLKGNKKPLSYEEEQKLKKSLIDK